MEKSNTLLGRCVRAASSAPFETCSKTLSIFAPRQNAKSSKIISWIPLKFYVCRAFLVFSWSRQTELPQKNVKT